MHAAHQTWDLIPLCHPIHLDTIEVAIGLGDAQVRIEATATIVERTGVEMEALTACSVAALVIVATLREVDPRPSIDDLELVSKEGGRSGRWVELTREPASGLGPCGCSPAIDRDHVGHHVDDRLERLHGAGRRARNVEHQAIAERARHTHAKGAPAG